MASIGTYLPTSASCIQHRAAWPASALCQGGFGGQTVGLAHGGCLDVSVHVSVRAPLDYTSRGAA